MSSDNYKIRGNTEIINESWNLNKTSRIIIERVANKYRNDDEYKKTCNKISSEYYYNNREVCKAKTKLRYYWVKGFGDTDWRNGIESWNLLRIGNVYDV